MRRMGFVFLGLLFAATVNAMGDIPQENSEGQLDTFPAARFTLNDLQGKKVSLESYKGKVVLLNFWASWCPPCRNEMPSMQKLSEKLKDDPFAILAVSIDESASTVRSFLEDKNYSFTILLDLKGEVALQYGVTGIPATFIIDKKGNIVHRYVGGRDWMEGKVLDQIKRLIKT